MDISQLAAEFVGLVLRRKSWKVVKEISDDEKRVFLAVLRAAALDAADVVQGVVKNCYRDEEGRSTDEEYIVNKYCPYKVIGKNGKDSLPAIIWLDSAFKDIEQKAYLGRDRAQIIESFRKVIDDSVPLASIQLTADGDMLREYPPSGGHYDCKHYRDKDKVEGCVGVHNYCGGFMDRIGATATKNAVLCRACHLRVLFPREIKTFGELREYLTGKLRPVAV